MDRRGYVSRAQIFGAWSALIVAGCGSSGGTNTTPPDGGNPDGGNPDDGNTDDGNTSDAGDGAALGLGFTPSNVDPGTLDLTTLADIDVTQGCGPIGSEGPLAFSCGMGSAKFTIFTQSNQIKVGIYTARSWRIEPNAILNVTGTYPLILVATDTIEILGGLVAAGQAQGAVAGGFRDTNTGNTPGGGPGGGGGGTATSGGGGGSYCGIGGSGAVTTGTAAAGGMANGTPEIVPLTGGSAGGQGFGQSGAGGGAIQLVAGNSVSVGAGAYVNVGGGGGGGGPNASGGGSGGSLLIESQAVTIAGVLAANGGGGGQGTNSLNGGGDALASNMPAPGGTDASQNSQGGNGSAGAMANGSNGNATATFSAGGGGGGAGRIRINTQSGSANLQGGTLSPDATTTCVTQGQVH